MVGPPLRCTCMPYFWQVLFEVFTQPLVVWYNNMWFWISAVVWVRVTGVAFVFLLGWCLAPQLDSVDGPCWILASS